MANCILLGLVSEGYKVFFLFHFHRMYLVLQVNNFYEQIISVISILMKNAYKSYGIEYGTNKSSLSVIVLCFKYLAFNNIRLNL